MLKTIATQVPAYCTSGHGVLTPAQWKACWNAGYNQSTTTAANAGAAVGHYAAPAIAILVIVLLVAAWSRAGGARKAATSR